MQNDRWKEITRIFHAALDLPPEDRHGFVSAASSDPDIQSEVEKLLLADEKADSYLESPLIPPGSLIAALTDQPQLRPGDILCQRFHILRAVGSGGMGQVFEAHDSELAVNVALKLIRPEVAANPQALARFRQEVRLARRITHPNVCRTFDLDRDTLTAPDGQQRTLVFLTMEFLDGETLAARLKRTGRLTLDEILVISRQIAAALDAAHALGIIHRDIKPGNIMLVPAGENSRQPARVVITDFGLARLDPVFSQDENSITQHSSHSAHPIGTLAYMAPEQMDGSPISATTDIYAFGLILFEMATGQRAFPSSNLLSGIAQRLSGPPPSPTSLQPGLPQSFEQAIQGCLRLKPEDRFQSAQAVMDCLECRTGQSQPLSAFDNSAGKPQPRPRRWTNWTSRNTLLSVAAILLLAVSLFLLGLRFQWWEGNARLDPGALVYLAPVTNQTGEKSLDNITELLQASLEQSAHINLLDQGRVGDTLQRMTKAPDSVIDPPAAREIAMRTGAVRVIFAAVTGTKGKYTLNIDIQEPDATSPSRNRGDWSRSFLSQTSRNIAPTGTISPQLLTTIRNASDWIRVEVGESGNDIARLDAPPEEITTANWDALSDLGNAERYYYSRQLPRAVDALRDAVAKDSHFAFAYVFLGDVLSNMGHQEQAFSAYRMALDSDAQNRLSLRERDRIKGIVAHDTADYEAAEVAYREYTLYYPNDYLGWFRRGRPLLMLGRSEESAAALQRAHLVDPGKAPAVVQLVRADLILGNSTEVHRWLNELPGKYPGDFFFLARGPVQVVEEDYAGALQTFHEFSQTSDPVFQWTSASMLADLLAEQGKYVDARKLISSKLESLSGIAALFMDRAQLNCRIEDFTSCVADVNKAMSIDPSPARAIAASVVLGRAIGHAPGKRNVSLMEALGTLQHMEFGPEYGLIGDLARLRIRGELFLANGSSAQAIVEFRKASQIDAPINSREYLARALIANAQHTENEASQTAMLREAQAIYAAIAFHPAVIWQFSLSTPPGFFADHLEAWLKLSDRFGDDPKRPEAIQTLKRLRPGSAELLRSDSLNPSLATKPVITLN